MVTDTGALHGEPLASLVAPAQAGDEVAFTRIVARYHPDLLRIAMVVSGDADLAAEAAQAAWVIAWRRLGDLRDAASLRPWLMSIAVNEARQLARSRSRRTVRELVVTDAAGSVAGPADVQIAMRVDLDAALASIDARDRALLGLRYLAGMDSTEIGHAVGMSATAVRSRLARARERLRRELGDD